MVDKDQLRNEIRTAFGSVAFPAHRGIRAALAGDDWVSDPEDLAKITAEKDIHGEWWTIPAIELQECTLALSYLDAAGIEYYLPAYLTMVLNDFKYSNYTHLISLLDPEFGKDNDLCKYFHTRFSKINGKKKSVCVKFLKFLKQNIDPNDIYSEFDELDRILQHDFWIL